MGKKVQKLMAVPAMFILLVFMLGACDGGGGGCNVPDPTPTPSPTPSPTPNPTPGPTPTPTPGDSGLTAVQFSQKMGAGWNLGNSLEAMGPGNETAWSNPVVTQQLINSVKAAGFDTIRIPVAWSAFSNASNYTIDPAWLNRVAQVVNYALNADMYVILNEHWDGGWLNHPFYSQQQSLNNRLSTMWRQIANHFRNYDQRLLFAGTNEVLNEGDYGTPSQEMVTVQNSFNQTFVNTVRATGGNNANRYLVVQAFNTNIDHAVNFFVLPNDTVRNRLFIEVHYYDPYNFTLNPDNVTTEWPSTSETWANEAWVDGQMRKMKTKFVDQGVAVILGEYCATSRLDVQNHEASRLRWNRYVTQSAAANGLVPVYWDAGYAGEQHASGLFNRNTGAQVYPNLINAIVGAAN